MYRQAGRLKWVSEGAIKEHSVTLCTFILAASPWRLSRSYSPRAAEARFRGTDVPCRLDGGRGAIGAVGCIVGPKRYRRHIKPKKNPVEPSSYGMVCGLLVQSYYNK